MKIVCFLIMVFMCLTCQVQAGQAQTKQVLVSAAASMTDAVQALILSFGNTHPEIKILANFASSGSLARQIDQGAPVDLYISANHQWLSHLLAGHHLDEKSVIIIAVNELVFVGDKASTVNGFADIASLRLIALGSPSNVPAGLYAKQALTAKGLYEKMNKNHQFIMTKDVRQALLYAERGEVDGAFVYKTDSLRLKKATLLFVVPGDLYKPVTYPMALTKAGGKNSEARKFFNFLQTTVARDILMGFGFLAPAKVNND